MVMITIYSENISALKKGKVAVLSQNGHPTKQEPIRLLTKSIMQTLDTHKDGAIRRFKEIMSEMDRRLAHN